MNIDKHLEGKNPINTLNHERELLKSYNERLNMLIYRIIQEKKHEYNLKKSYLESLNPLSIMDKGYSISEIDGKIITDVDDVKLDSTLVTKVKNGYILSNVNEVNKNGK